MTASMSRLDRGSAVAAVSRALSSRSRGIDASGTLQDRLAATIEGQIVPRLLARRARAEAASDTISVDGQQVLDLAAFAIAHDAEATRHYVQATAGHLPFESICFSLLGPAARHLGDLWVEDLCSFADVTLGLLHLQHALHGLAPAHGGACPEGFRRRRILLAPVPGEQHTFGLSMVESFFHRAGWNVTALSGGTIGELANRLRHEWFGVLGLSVGSEAQLGPIRDEIAALRCISRNRSIGVMIGGPIFAQTPSLAQDVGADGTAADGLQATYLAENLLGARLHAP